MSTTTTNGTTNISAIVREAMLRVDDPDSHPVRGLVEIARQVAAEHGVSPALVQPHSVSQARKKIRERYQTVTPEAIVKFHREAASNLKDRRKAVGPVIGGTALPTGIAAQLPTASFSMEDIREVVGLSRRVGGYDRLADLIGVLADARRVT